MVIMCSGSKNYPPSSCERRYINGAISPANQPRHDRPYQALKASLVVWDVCYGLVRSAHTLEQAGYVQTDFIKFVWVYWRPDNIPVMRKMQIGVNEGEMKTRFSPYHAELQACTVDDLGEGPLADVLDSVTMRYSSS